MFPNHPRHRESGTLDLIRIQGRPHEFVRLHFLRRAWRYRLRSEKAAVAFLMSRQLAGKTVVDIGANIGIYSYWMHK